MLGWVDLVIQILCCYHKIGAVFHAEFFCAFLWNFNYLFWQFSHGLSERGGQVKHSIWQGPWGNPPVMDLMDRLIAFQNTCIQEWYSSKPSPSPNCEDGLENQKKLFWGGDELTNYTTKSMLASSIPPWEGLVYPHTICHFLPANPKPTSITALLLPGIWEILQIWHVLEVGTSAPYSIDHFWIQMLPSNG